LRYYSEEKTKNLRLALEKEVLSWPQIGTKKMFGCPCYQAKGKLFVFLVTKGIVITLLELADRQKLSRARQTSFFQAGKKIVKNWIRLSINSKDDLDEILPFVRKSYEEALKKA
jgi:hypothetical protein